MPKPENVPDYAFGTLVSVDNILGRVCSGKSTLMFPDGIYCVEYVDALGEPRHDWFHTADLRLATEH